MAACIDTSAVIQHQQAAEQIGPPGQQQLQLQMQEPPISASRSYSTTGLAATDADNVSVTPTEDDAHARVLQLLPGLSPAMLHAVAARMLDGAAVTMGRRLGCGAFATVYEAQLSGSRAKWVVKRLDRVAPEHAQQVRGRNWLQLSKSPVQCSVLRQLRCARWKRHVFAALVYVLPLLPVLLGRLGPSPSALALHD
jgi:hypothetical protein